MQQPDLCPPAIRCFLAGPVVLSCETAEEKAQIPAQGEKSDEAETICNNRFHFPAAQVALVRDVPPDVATARGPSSGRGVTTALRGSLRQVRCKRNRGNAMRNHPVAVGGQDLASGSSALAGVTE